MTLHNLNVLLVENNISHASRIVGAFAKQFPDVSVTLTESLAEAKACLADYDAHLIITSLHLPDGSGLGLVSDAALDGSRPVIITTPQGNPEKAVEVMRQGAQDYVVKSEAALAAMPRIAERVLRQWGHIVEKRRAERALERKSMEFESIFKAIPDATVFTDAEHHIIRCNPAVSHIFGYQPQDIVGQHISLLYINEMDYQARNRAWQALSPKDKLKPYEVSYRRQDGSEFLSETVSTAVKDAGGQALGYLHIIRNITERKALEEQFQQAHKMEAVGQLAGGVAHDFNNLLNIILGYCELLLGYYPDTPQLQRQEIGLIKDAAERATDLTRQLLTFSRKRTSQPQAINISETVSHFKNLLYRVIGEDVQLITRLEPNLPNIEADPSQIDQILMNLCVNARDAMPQGGTLSIETTVVQRDNIPNLPDPDLPDLPDYYVLLAVSDTGSGMSEETRKRIFEPFFTTKEVGKGTGLGLATVYGVVNQSQGHIVVESELGEGTTFYIYLPPQAKELESQQIFSSTVEQAKGDEIILLVEDEKDLRTLIRKFLMNLGYTVLEAEDPEDALMIFKTHGSKIDLLLTDVIMPYMSGHDLALRLQNLRPELKVLYISGYTDDVLSQYGLEASQVPLLEKPFSSESLGRKIRETMMAPVTA